MIVLNHENFKYHEWLKESCQKMRKDFVKMNLVNVIAMKDQFLDEETRRGNIARKTVQTWFAIQQGCPFLYGQKRIHKGQSKSDCTGSSAKRGAKKDMQEWEMQTFLTWSHKKYRDMPSS